jgi:hypothetical protein
MYNSRLRKNKRRKVALKGLEDQLQSIMKRTKRVPEGNELVRLQGNVKRIKHEISILKERIF